MNLSPEARRLIASKNENYVPELISPYEARAATTAWKCPFPKHSEWDQRQIDVNYCIDRPEHIPTGSHRLIGFGFYSAIMATHRPFI